LGNDHAISNRRRLGVRQHGNIGEQDVQPRPPQRRHGRFFRHATLKLGHAERGQQNLPGMGGKLLQYRIIAIARVNRNICVNQEGQSLIAIAHWQLDRVALLYNGRFRHLAQQFHRAPQVATPRVNGEHVPGARDRKVLRRVRIGQISRNPDRLAVA
jgi:hypothetical protein